jgi:hypothetical protein
VKEPSLPDKVVAIDRALDAAGVPHAFGGAIALAYYAEPRATVDVDVNVFVGSDHVDTVRAALAPLGVAFLPTDDLPTHDLPTDDKRTDETRVARDGQIRWWWGRTPVDVFFSYDAVHDAMREAVRDVPFGEDRIPVLGPEHLMVCKVVFDRDKDWLDITQVLTAVPDLAIGEVRRWLTHLLPGGDERRRHFDELAGQILGQ